MPSQSEFSVHGFRVILTSRPAFEALGYTALVRLDGAAIPALIQTLTETGQVARLRSTLPAPQQVWVCLSGSEGRPDADCRCTLCVERTPEHDLSGFSPEELFTLHVPASQWAVFEVGPGQTPHELHQRNVYGMAGEIGYRFNHHVGLHFDNQHEWEPGKTMRFLLPVTPAHP